MAARTMWDAPEQESAPLPLPSHASRVRANAALQHFVFKGGRTEHYDAELAVARAIDQALAEAKEVVTACE